MSEILPSVSDEVERLALAAEFGPIYDADTGEDVTAELFGNIANARRLKESFIQAREGKGLTLTVDELRKLVGLPD